jgi:hypothetical protein
MSGGRCVYKEGKGGEVTEMRKYLLNRSRVRDSGCVDGEGVGGAVSFDSKRAKVKEEILE